MSIIGNQTRDSFSLKRSEYIKQSVIIQYRSKRNETNTLGWENLINHPLNKDLINYQVLGYLSS